MILFFLLLSLSFAADAAVTVPRQLDRNDRIEALEILGFGTAGKVLSNPYPLGGYYGIEMALSFEAVDVRGLSELGDLSGAQAEPQDELVYPTLSFGKGIYGNIDVFFHFIPFIERISLSKFGGLLRWGFFQSNRWPVNLSAVLQAGSSNIDNKIITTSYGYAVVGSFQLWDFSLFAGAGRTQVKGRFMGDSEGANDSGITDSGLTEQEESGEAHTFFGVSYQPEPIFFTFEVDRIADTSYGLRMGFRF